jgi:hypothetical protein
MSNYDPPTNWSHIHPHFLIPEWESIGLQSLTPIQWSRHFMINGETGSGKTESVIKPLIRSCGRYPESRPYQDYRSAATATGRKPESVDELRNAIFLLDAKGELHGELERESTRRRIHIIDFRRPSSIVYLHEGRASTAGDVFSIVDPCLQLSDYFSRAKHTHTDPFWHNSARHQISELVRVDLALFELGGIENIRKFRADLGARLKKGGLLDENDTNSIEYARDNYFRTFDMLLNLTATDKYALATYLDLTKEFAIPQAMTFRLGAFLSLPDTTASCIQATINVILDTLASPELAGHCSLNPFEPPPPDKYLSLKKFLQNGEAIVFCPRDDSSLAPTVANLLKMKIFEAVFSSPRPRPFAYICDEAQKFVSSDPSHGEQGFIDRCRAYRVGMTICSQSLSSLRFRLEGDSPGFRAITSLDILLNNCGNQFYFRTNDLEVQDRLRRLIPEPPIPGRPHVTALRPVTTLQTGQMYYLTCDGKWGVSRIDLDPGACSNCG